MQAAEETDSSTLRDGIEQLGVAETAPGGEDESVQEREDTGLATTTGDETKSESVKSMFFISIIYTIAVESSL